MTNEEKAIAYDKALEKAKNIRFGNPQSVTANICEEIFPELKVSEDEKIRKELKSFFDSEISDHGNVEWRNGIMYAEIVAWLEKQGEQKPADFEKKRIKSIMKYIDLGLPSGTLWCDTNKEGYYAFEEAVKNYGDSLPAREQFEELIDQCKWWWMGNGYKVTGPNGNYIILPAAGIRSCDGSVYNVGSRGDYWSSAPYDSDDAWGLYFGSGGVGVYNYGCYHGFSVRLVK